MLVNVDWMLDADIDGVNTVTLGPKFGVFGGGAVPPPTGVRLKFCAVVALQVYCSNWTLSLSDAPGVSRHRPLLRLTKWYEPSALATGCHCWLSPLPYCQSWISALFAVDTPV